MLQQFLDAYIECALWLSTDDDGEPLDSYTVDDITTETLRDMIADCKAFWRDNKADCQAHGTPAQCGHDFWLTRNRHGAGFWDRGTGDIGQRLTAAAHIYGDINLFVNDAGRIYS
jgi:hypothetical protein